MQWNWPEGCQSEHIQHAATMTHQATWVPIPERPLTQQEQSWVNEILSASKHWADVSVGELSAIGRCACGFCRAIQLERPTRPQNPSATSQGQVGDIDIYTSVGDVINVALYARDGSLSDLDLLCEFGFKPIPENWTEVSRHVEAR
jgi:hypothetical protein